MKMKIATGLILSAVTVAAFAGPVEDQIKTRQSAYSFLGWNTQRIKSQVSDHPETYNKEQVIFAANVIAAIANSPLLDLYAPGSDQGTSKPSSVKSAPPAKAATIRFGFAIRVNVVMPQGRGKCHPDKKRPAQLRHFGDSPMDFQPEQRLLIRLTALNYERYAVHFPRTEDRCYYLSESLRICRSCR